MRCRTLFRNGGHAVKHFRSSKSRALALVGLSAVGSAAFAGGEGTDYSTLVDAVDFSTVATGVLGVAAALIVVYITIKGVKLMMGFVRGG